MNWRRRLANLMADKKGTGYSYSDLANLLGNLGFELCIPSGGSSHRKFRFKRDAGAVVWVGLVEKGHGEVPPGYVRTMQRTLRLAKLA